MYAIPQRKPIQMADLSGSLSSRGSSQYPTESPSPYPPGSPFVAPSQPTSGPYGANYQQYQVPFGHRKTAYERLDAVEGDLGGSGDRRSPRGHHFDPLSLMADAAVVLLPVAMVAVVLIIWQLDGREYVQGSLDTWQNAITILATAFPILFAAIVGRAMAAAAHWNLEKGAEIGHLEILMGSRTVGSTIITLFQLRHVRLITLGLLMLWSLSPLGAQGFLRILNTEVRLERTPTNVVYYDMNNPSTLGLESPRDSTPEENVLNVMAYITRNTYTAVLMTPKEAMTSPMDVWGNVKIPFLKHGIEDGSSNDDDGWRSVYLNTSEVQYASLIGVPMNDSFPAGNTTFSMESSYLDLQCADISQAEERTQVRSIMSEYRNQRIFENVANGTWWAACPNGAEELHCDTFPYWQLALDNFVDGYWVDKAAYFGGGGAAARHTPALFADEQGVEARETKLLFEATSFEKWTRDDVHHNYTTTCDAVQTYVESRIHCSKAPEPNAKPACEVVAHRPSRRPHPPSNITFLSFPTIFTRLSRTLPYLIQHPFQPDFSLSYLYNSRIEGLEFVPLDEVPGDLFSRRLTQLVNSFIGASQMVIHASAGTITRKDFPHGSLETRTETTTDKHFVKISLPWISVALISCVVLTVFGIISVVLMHLSTSPEMLGYVSSSLRDSKYVQIPVEVRSLDALSVTRRVQRRRVRLGHIDSPHGGHEDAPLLGIVDDGDARHVK